MRYCVQCGYEIVERVDNLYKCSNGHENWLNPAPGAVAFILKEGKVLYGVRGIEPSIGRLSLVGGFVEPNESLEEAVIREAKEELGIDIEIIDFLGSYPHEYAKDKPSLPMVFVAEYVDGTITPADDLNGGSPEWRNIDNLPKNDEVTWPWYEKAHQDLRAWYASRR